MNTSSTTQHYLNFGERAARAIGAPLTRSSLTTLQINLGKRCNMACLHCHVEAGPKRTEEMSATHIDEVLELLRLSPQLTTLDLTGGAPELHPHFKRLVSGARALGRRVIDRCNLSILLEPGQEELASFLAKHGVEVVASLPCYLEENVERQRGKGSFSKSVEGLRLLNTLGYGLPHHPLILNLVYNPTGPSLPPAQETLQEAYHQELKSRFGIEFNHLFTITNMPIKRFHDQLRRHGDLEAYQTLLIDHFNEETLDSLMCRELVSVSWDGRLYDCDFNQMLEVPLGASPQSLSALLTLARADRLHDLNNAMIRTDSHCFGCTAGAGSSCGGALS